MSELTKLWCETDADWDAFVGHPSDITWANYAESKRKQDELEIKLYGHVLTEKEAEEI